MVVVRVEEEEDQEAVRRINLRAFQGRLEADIVDRLRRELSDYLSLVAEDRDRLIGHIFFSPVEVDMKASLSAGSLKMMGLAPMAVLPERQRQGVGSSLVRAGLRLCRRQGVQAVVVLGHPEYYPRFGFKSADEFGLSNEFNLPPEVFMALEIETGALEEVSGMVKYHSAFSQTG